MFPSPSHPSLRALVCNATLCVMLALLVACDVESVDEPELGLQSTALSADNHQSLAAYWSPIIYQDTHYYVSNVSPTPHQYEHDYITKFNYDGNYDGRDNWDHVEIGNHPMPAAVYYSVSETLTHYFIGYYFYHARDEDSGTWDFHTHENDLEGMLISVRKADGSACTNPRGCLVAMETQSHGFLYQYGYAAGISEGGAQLENGAPYPFRVKIGAYAGADHTSGSADDGAQGVHPLMFVENRGHGVRACDAVSSSDTSQDCDHADGGNGIVYYYSDNSSDTPDPTTGGDGDFTKRYRYSLIAMDQCGPGSSCTAGQDIGLWSLRYHSNDNPTAPDDCDAQGNCPMRGWAGLAGNDSGGAEYGGGEMPMWWDDKDDGASYAGDWLCDPAKLFDTHLNGVPFDSQFSHTYTDHVYWTHYVELDALRVDAPSLVGKEIYVNVSASKSPSGTNTVIDRNHWGRTVGSTGVWYPWRYGGGQAQSSLQYGDNSSRHYFCRPQDSQITFSVKHVDIANVNNVNGVPVATEVQTGPRDERAGKDLGPVALRYRHVQNQANQLCCGESLDVRIGLEAESGVLTAPMRVNQSWLASAGRYVQVANGDGSGGQARYGFELDREGWYQVWGHEASRNGNDDSFFVSIDDGDEATWDTTRTGNSNRFVWDRVRDRSAGPMAYYLEPGHHELTIRQREDGTQLDRILITSDPSYVPYDVQMEAESGVLSWPMRATTYFANNYVWVPNGSHKGGSVSYNLNLPADGQFLLWGRVNAPTSGDDSFFVSIDSGASSLWDTARTSSTGWAWDIVSDRYTGDTMFDVSAGAHVLRIRRREDGAKLDQLILTNDLGFTPADPALDLSQLSSQPL